MVILYRTFGNVSNQFLQHANLYAYCTERGIHFLDLNEARLFAPYEGKRRIAGRVAYRVVSTGLKAVVKGGLVSVIDLSQDSEAERFERECAGEGIMLVSGWGFSKPDSLKAFREHFRVRMERAFPDGWSRSMQGKPVLGLHVRRGDYATYEKGRYFWDDSTYVEVARKAASALGLGHARLLVFSNDGHLDLGPYAEAFPDCLLSKEPYWADHLLMARCDFLVGPPSTFTQWASYIGSVPLLAVRDPSAPIAADSFKVFPEI